MTTILIPAVAIVCTMTAQVQKPIVTEAKIESARVYTNGAELKHKTSVKIPAGTSEIVITNIANVLNENTIQISVPKHITVMSVQYSNAYIEEYDNNDNSPLAKTVKDELGKKEKELKTLQNQLTAERKSIELLDKNQSMSHAQNFSIIELGKLLEYYKTKRTELNNNIYSLEQKEIILKEEISLLKGKLSFSHATSEKVSQGKLIVNIMSNESGNIPLQISYLTAQAHWQPSYELRIDQINTPIQAIYKAKVQQSTGLDWKNIKLSLTSGAANQNTHAPQLQPWFIGYQDEEVFLYKKDDLVASRKKSNQAETSFLLTLEGQATGVTVKKETSLEYSEDKYTYDTDISSIDNFTAIDESQMNITYHIDIPYTVLTNNKTHSVALKSQNIPAEYQYTCIPKYDRSVFLIAKIKDYAQYDLLSGEATVIFEGAYIGKTHITPSSESEGLVLSLGRDSNISVSRKKINEQSGMKMLSSRKQQDFVYEITTRNNKKSTIAIEIQDQYPLSSDKDIEVNLVEKNGAKVDTETGKVSWLLKLNPNETKKIRMSYQIKYAKDKKIDWY